MRNSIKHIILLLSMVCTSVLVAQINDGDGGIAGELEPGMCPTGIRMEIDSHEVNFIEGVPEIERLDSDGDGILDINEELGDCDHDGLDNKDDFDSDNDGIHDGIDLCVCTEGPVQYRGCPQPDERYVHWVHGYEGDADSWRPVAEDVHSQFKVLSHITDYSSSFDSLGIAATRLEENIAYNENTGVAGPSYYDPVTQRNILVAHSLGGMVTRKMGKLYSDVGNPMYGGIVTVGSAHFGVYAAQFMNSKNGQEEVKDYMAYSCEALTKGSFLEGDTSGIGVGKWLLTGLGILGKVQGSLCDAVGSDSVFHFAETFLGNEVIHDELTPAGMDTIAPLHAAHNAVAYGVEWGHEDNSLTPRFYGGMLPDKKKVHEFDAYQADDIAIDGRGMSYVADKFAHYKEMAEFHKNRYFFWKTFCPPVCLPQLVEFRRWLGYEEGIAWFPTLDPTWKRFIGAENNELELVETIERCFCFVKRPDIDEDGICEFPCEDIDQIPNPCGECHRIERIEEKVYKTVSERTLSDGFILRTSAAESPGRNTEYEPFEMDGSNHFQMRNDPRTERLRDWIFQDGCGNKEDGFFKTKKR